MPIQGHVSSDRRAAAMKTDALLLQVQDNGNNFPAHLRQTDDINFEQFKRLLKTFLFSCWERGPLWLTAKFAPSKSSYVLTICICHLDGAGGSVLLDTLDYFIKSSTSLSVDSLSALISGSVVLSPYEREHFNRFVFSAFWSVSLTCE